MGKRDRIEKQNPDRKDLEDSVWDLESDAEEELTENGEEIDEWEEERLTLRAKLLIFAGLFVLSAIICACLWIIMHPADADGQGSGGQGTLADATASPTPDASEESVTASSVEPSGEAVSGPDPGALGEAEGEAGSETAGGISEEAVSGSLQTPSAPAGESDPMSFSSVSESVTPKDLVNLRTEPTTADESNIMVQITNGEILRRTGINTDTGWSEIEYDGMILYAVSQYLTEDLDYRPAVETADPNRVSTAGGRIIIFTDCDDWISPKEYVNLRTEPSTLEGNATVSVQLNYGEKVHRTGYSAENGWSRVEYADRVLYVVTSLMYEVTE